MKTLISLIIVGGFLSLTSCSSRHNGNGADIQLIDSDAHSITVNVGAPKPEYKAMYQLLFRGIPNSNQSAPLISTSEEDIKRDFPNYFDVFFKQNRFQTFITSSIKNSNGIHKVTINVKALRLDLEKNSIIRKFGY